ncbi:MAG: pyridoxine 5'-phosphate synthase PdxJ [Gammaproteobacteria bacterium]|jgi:pyridoxine 5'-phosphate synthase PdxJ
MLLGVNAGDTASMRQPQEMRNRGPAYASLIVAEARADGPMAYVRDDSRNVKRFGVRLARDTLRARLNREHPSDVAAVGLSNLKVYASLGLSCQNVARKTSILGLVKMSICRATVAQIRFDDSAEAEQRVKTNLGDRLS